jgi:hypothetical protein
VLGGVAESLAEDRSVFAFVAVTVLQAGGPNFCSMKITEDVCRYAAESEEGSNAQDKDKPDFSNGGVGHPP